MNVINVIEVDNQALTNTHEVLAQFRQLVSNHSLYLPELVSYKPHLAAGLKEIAVIAVRGDVQDVARGYSQQVIRGRYDQMCIGHFCNCGAKVLLFCEICKFSHGYCMKYALKSMK